MDAAERAHSIQGSKVLGQAGIASEPSSMQSRYRRNLKVLEEMEGEDRQRLHRAFGSHSNAFRAL